MEVLHFEIMVKGGSKNAKNFLWENDLHVVLLYLCILSVGFKSDESGFLYKFYYSNLFFSLTVCILMAIIC